MDYRILGPLEIWDGGQMLGLGGAKQRALLADLLIHAGEVVSTDRLIDDLWGENPPDTAQSAVQVHVSGLRKVLGRTGSPLITKAPGYLLRVGPSELDLHRFEQLAEEGREAREGEARRASIRLREALDLWRGEPLADFAYEGFAQSQIERLTKLRLSVTEDRIEADLTLGRHKELVSDLEALSKEHPLRERIRAQLMLAFYRSGRQADALSCYQHARAVLADELGIDPGPELRKLEKAILEQDPDIEWVEQERQIGPEHRQERSPSAPMAARAVRLTAEAPSDSTPRPETRKTVSIVFCDITGSTALGERLDPEALRDVMTRYFDVARTALERHGGTVEKFIGDAVVAVFGIPLVHEDDALRATRAAADLRDDLARLNKELERERWVTIAVRIGVHTGEVVAGDASTGQAMMSGDPGNVAARLEQSAAPGEVLLSATTMHLVRDAVTVESVGPLELKGRSERIDAHRLIDITRARPGHVRRMDAPLVGRARELRLLADAYAGVVSERSCHLFTVLGPAGIGKSRLVEEFLAGLPHATVLRGRCLPYGEGITFWPLFEAVRQAAGLLPTDTPTQERAKISALMSSDAAAEEAAARVAELIGGGDVGLVAIDEAFWAARKLFESLGRAAPLVLAFDDLQWAEHAFLDLLDNVTELSRDSAIFLACIARPEFLEVRQGWGGGKFNSISLMLEALGDEEASALARDLLGGADLPATLGERVVALAEGNPLFIEETLGMLVDEGLLVDREGRWVMGDVSRVRIPPTIQALLAARLDRCSGEERVLLGRAAVIGKVFYRGALEDLGTAGEDLDIAALLTALVRNGLIAPDPGDLPGEDAYRFHHILFRDAAYEALAKKERAKLHERLAGWLELRMAGTEADAFTGYHLEQAHRYLTELAPADERALDLAQRAAEHLAAAGSRAYERLDLHAAANLLRRALALLSTGAPERVEVLVELAEILADDVWSGEPREAAELLGEALKLGADPTLHAGARLLSAKVDLLLDPRGKVESALETVDELIPVLSQAGDERGLGAALDLRALIHWFHLRFDSMRRDAFEAANHGAKAGDRRAVIRALMYAFLGGYAGSMSAEDLLERSKRLAPEFSSSPGSEPYGLIAWALALALIGRIEEARASSERALEMTREFGSALLFASETRREVELLAGNFDAAERQVREIYDECKRAGDLGHLSSMAGMLGRIMCDLGRAEEALPLADECRELSAPEDLINQWLWRAARARALAQRGDHDEAERLAQEAVAAIAPTDAILYRGYALCDLADVLTVTGKTEDAIGALQEALVLYEQKGVIPLIDRTRSALAMLDDP